MKITSQNGVLTIALGSECTIAMAEADTEKLKTYVSGTLNRIELKAQAVEEIDTAYLQIPLSLKAAADKIGIPFSVSELSPEFERVCNLYGVNLNG
jgi:anti-anti-sigma regulatory factor